MQCSARDPLAELDLAMQQSAALEQVRRDVEVLLRDSIGKRDSTALPWWPCAVDGVAAVSDFVPERAGDEFVLRTAGPLAIACRVPVVRMQHFLQEQDVGGEAVQAVAQFVDHDASRELGEALVDVVRRDRKAHG